MTQYSKGTFDSLYVDSAGTFADNTTRDISEGDLRQFAEDIKDSTLFILGGGAVLTQRTVLSAANITSSYTSPVTLISAPGAGYTIIPLMYYFFYDWNTTIYATNYTFNIKLGSVAVSANDSTLLVDTADAYRMLSPTNLSTNTNVSNSALTFQLVSGDATAGDSIVYMTTVYTIAQNG